MWWTYHLIISAIITSLYFLFTLDSLQAILLFLTGFLIDVDHYIVFSIFRHESFSDFYKKFYDIVVKNGDDSDVSRYMVPFHNFEFMIFLIILSFYNSFFVPITIGALSHFITDVIWIRRFKLKNYYSLVYFTYYKLFKNRL